MKLTIIDITIVINIKLTMITSKIKKNSSLMKNNCCCCCSSASFRTKYFSIILLVDVEDDVLMVNVVLLWLIGLSIKMLLALLLINLS